MTTTMNKEKRIRSSNFNKEEELLLVHEIGKLKNIIECKTTNKISVNEKEEAWQKILKSFNAQNIEVRSLSQIKSKYDNLKTKARKECAKYKTYLRGTGGGPSVKDELDAVIQAILEIINVKTVVGFTNSFDNDSGVTSVNNFLAENSENVIMEEVQICEGNDDRFLNVSEFEGIHQCPTLEYSNVSGFENVEIINHCDVGFQNSKVIDPVVSLEHNYGIPDEKENMASCSTPISGKTHSMRKGTDPSPNSRQQDSNWSKYVPSKLQFKRNSKLRPTVPNVVFTAKEQYYKRKLELLEQSFEKENDEREKRMKREDEEHQAKMFMLKLNIELKQNEIEKQKKDL